MKLLLNFLPIIIIFLLVSYSDMIATWSHSILGKLVAVILIIFYTRIDVIYGLVVCAIVIFYYQTDYVEGFRSEVEGFSSSGEDDLADESGDAENQEDIAEDVSLDVLVDTNPEESQTETFIYDPSVDKFRQKHCSKGHLLHKGQIVKPEMAEHVFPQIEQNDFHKCNICDYSCDFKFIDRKIQAQDDLMKPLSGRETR